MFLGAGFGTNDLTAVAVQVGVIIEVVLEPDDSRFKGGKVRSPFPRRIEIPVAENHGTLLGGRGKVTGLKAAKSGKYVITAICRDAVVMNHDEITDVIALANLDLDGAARAKDGLLDVG